MNSVRLYSNGTAVISREYEFDGMEPLRISIPVRKSDLDDVVSSIAVFGDVTITDPPTYTPTNADEAKLYLDPSGAFHALARKLAGADVEVEAGVSYKGKLLGLQPFRREYEESFLEECRFVILTEKGVQQVAETTITAIRFTEPVVQAEIHKALRSSLGTIKPNSSKVELTLRPNPGSDGATVTYATPVAAWKIRYQLRLTPEGAELDGQAVVDNDTDDDWSETMITVITGEPITFSTDLAEIRRPQRSRVNIVGDHATGAVIAEPQLMRMSMAPPNEGKSRGGGYGAPRDSEPLMSPRSQAVAAGPLESQVDFHRTPAERPEAETRESGDFSIFTSPAPVNLGAGRSAIIPLFRTGMGEAKVILLYQEKDDPQRPFRAVRFKNQAEHSLGRGVCEVFAAGDFQGKCVMEPTKPGEETLLVHAKEMGVRVHKTAGRQEVRREAIRITKGTIYNELRYRQKTSYRIQNSHAESFVLEIEHLRAWLDSEIKVSVSSGVHEEADIPSGKRIRVTLPVGQGLEVEVMEQRVEETQLALSALWLSGTVIGAKALFPPNQEMQACIDLQAKIDAIQAEIREKGEASSSLGEDQERLIMLIPNAHDEQASAWRTDLAVAENELREIKRTVLPQLRVQLKQAQDALGKALRGLKYSWTEDTNESLLVR